MGEMILPPSTINPRAQVGYNKLLIKMIMLASIDDSKISGLCLFTE
jgi:hypothetical protein